MCVYLSIFLFIYFFVEIRGRPSQGPPHPSCIYGRFEGILESGLPCQHGPPVLRQSQSTILTTMYFFEEISLKSVA